MPSEWRTVAIGTLCKGIFDGPHATPKKTDFGPVFLGISSISGGRIDLSGMEYLSEADFVKWTRRVTPKERDLVFSYETRLGEAALIPKGLRCCLGRRLALLRIDEKKANPRFLLYSFLAPEFQQTIVERTIHGSTVDRIPLIEFGKFPICVPDLRTQDAVAEILAVLDDRIELLKKTNETLEAMARAIFKSWFVDFDPVRAKAEGSEPEGMDAATAALLPREFQPSQLGPIPKGWGVATLGDIGHVIDCLHSKKPDRVQAGKPFLQLCNISDDGTLDLSDNYYISDVDYRRWTSRLEASPGDCIITNVGRVGAVAQIPSDFRAALGRNMTGIRCCKSYAFPTFLIELLTAPSMRNEIDLKTDSGTILESLNVRSIPLLRFVKPPVPIVGQFENICRPLRARMESSLTQIRTLASLRDTLLPRLISGKLRVPEAEAMLAEAG